MKTTTVQVSDRLEHLEERKPIAKALSKVLADSFILYTKTLNYHWNVEGSRFVGIHKLTEEHYNEMLTAIDAIAERMRALGFYAPGSCARYLELTGLKESPSEHTSAEAMLTDLVDDHMLISKEFEQAALLAEEHHDHSTADLFAGRRKFHDQAAWMLRSLTK